MSLSSSALVAGEAVYHPKYGFGSVHSLTQRDRLQPVHERSSAGVEPERTEEYYDIHLLEGGSVLVPVGRAESVGLRRLTAGIEAVKAHLCSPAEGLPANFRERAAELRMRAELAQPAGLATAVRDLVAHGRGRALSEGEKIWLDKSCQRLSSEAALVDNIPMFEARALILAVIRELSGSVEDHKQAKPASRRIW